MYSVVRKFFFIQLNFDIKDIKEKTLQPCRYNYIGYLSPIL